MRKRILDSSTPLPSSTWEPRRVQACWEGSRHAQGSSSGWGLNQVNSSTAQPASWSLWW